VGAFRASNPNALSARSGDEGFASAPVPNAVLIWAAAAPAPRSVMSKNAAINKLNLA